MSLTRRKNRWYYSIYFNGQRYRGSCKTSKAQEAKRVESLVLAKLLEDGRRRARRKSRHSPISQVAFFHGWMPCRRIGRRRNQPESITG